VVVRAAEPAVRARVVVRAVAVVGVQQLVREVAVRARARVREVAVRARARAVAVRERAAGAQVRASVPARALWRAPRLTGRRL